MHHRQQFRAMGTEMLVIVDSRDAAPPPSLREVPVWFEEWEACLSRFRPESELSGLNRTYDTWVQVSPDLWAVYELAVSAEIQSGGLVTPTIHDVLAEAGYDRDFPEVTSTRGTTVVRDYRPDVPALSRVLDRPPERAICLPRGVRLDFGGVAKGWAAHQTMLRLRSQGPTLVDAGGDIAISGPCLDDQPWIVGIAYPFRPGDDMAFVELRGGGIATSGKDRHRWQSGDGWKHHLIDPGTGDSAATDVLRATVIAPTVIEAERAAKTAFLLGSEAGLRYLETEPSFAGLLVLEDATTLATDRFGAYLT